MKQYNIFRTPVLAAVALATLVCTSSCNSIFEDSDCVDSSNLIKLTYTYNLKNADAFSSETSRVSVFAFDSSTGKLVKRVEAHRSDLTANNEVRLDVPPGSYDVLVWGGEHSRNFDIAVGSVGESTLGDFHCYLRRNLQNESDDALDLFHALEHLELPYASPSNPHRATIDLKKNTNAVRVVLQHLSGAPVEADNFEFTITDGNGWLNHDNTLKDNTAFTYRPVFTRTGSVEINNNPQDPPGTHSSAQWAGVGRGASVLGASLAEFSVSRLLTENKPMLTITNKTTGKRVLSVPLIHYALLVKGYEHASMPDQEYLDRQDEYNMTFFLDEGGNWMNTVIIINNWRIVRNVTPAQ